MPLDRRTIDRRHLMRGALALGSLGMAGCSTLGDSGAALPIYDRVPPLAPVRARADRLFDITVCLRPFRAAGPRLDAEEIGRTFVVHNYGHGGSGWSLSWGSGTIALRKAMSQNPKAIAVIGCGALGLTAARLAQDAGLRVTIYTRDLPPQTRSYRATGTFTPDSRIALTSAAAPDFAAQWEEMARISFKAYRSYLGLPGTPVEWSDRYFLSNLSPEEVAAHQPPPDPLGFAKYSDRIGDLLPKTEVLPPGASPFPTPSVRRTANMVFNIPDYAHTLTTDFLLAGGTIEHREFHSPADFNTLKEKVVINCTGYAARALMNDNSIVPVRGQIGWLIPQPEVNYGIVYDGVSMLARRDSIVMQDLRGGDMRGYNDANETVDRAESVAVVEAMAALYAKFGRQS
jgi:glycine/D-amino acid oxidase-like deaminating enzyme